MATRSSVRSFARTALSWESEFLMSQNDLVLSHSADRAEAANKAKGGNEGEGEGDGREKDMGVEERKMKGR